MHSEPLSGGWLYLSMWSWTQCKMCSIWGSVDCSVGGVRRTGIMSQTSTIHAWKAHIPHALSFGFSMAWSSKKSKITICNARCNEVLAKKISRNLRWFVRERTNPRGNLSYREECLWCNFPLERLISQLYKWSLVCEHHNSIFWRKSPLMGIGRPFWSTHS